MMWPFDSPDFWLGWVIGVVGATIAQVLRGTGDGR